MQCDSPYPFQPRNSIFDFEDRFCKEEDRTFEEETENESKSSFSNRK